MTQQALAEMTQVSRQTIISIESHRYTPSLLLALKISKAFDLAVEEVFAIVPNSGDDGRERSTLDPRA